LIEQLQPLYFVVEILTVDQIRELAEFLPAQAMNDVIEFPVIRSQGEPPRILGPFGVDPASDPSAEQAGFYVTGDFDRFFGKFAKHMEIMF
jgi:hypothetical protein